MFTHRVTSGIFRVCPVCISTFYRAKADDAAHLDFEITHTKTQEQPACLTAQFKQIWTPLIFARQS